MALGRADSRVENLMVTMKSNSFVTHPTHLLSWMVFANLWVSFLTEKRQSTPDKPPLCYYAATFSPDDNTWTLKKVSGRMFCNIFFLSCSPFHLFNQPFHCPFIQLVLVCPRKTMSPFLLQWMNRRMLRVHVPRHVLV